MAALFGEINVVEETPSFQDHVCSQSCKHNCAIGESYSHIPPRFPDATWVRWQQWVFVDIMALNVGLNCFFQNSIKGITSSLTNVLVAIQFEVMTEKQHQFWHQGFGNTHFKADVEPSGSKVNESNGIFSVSIVTCKYGICHATCSLGDWC